MKVTGEVLESTSSQKKWRNETYVKVRQGEKELSHCSFVELMPHQQTDIH